MNDIFKLIWRAVVELFRSRASLEAEILTLRHQINVLRRNSAKRPAFTNIDRLVFAALYRLVPRVVNALVIVEPQTVIGWHRAGFRLFWRWKSRCDLQTASRLVAANNGRRWEKQFIDCRWLMLDRADLVHKISVCQNVLRFD